VAAHRPALSRRRRPSQSSRRRRRTGAFRDQAWSDNSLFDFIKQSYLLTARCIQGAVKHVEGLDERTARKVDFYTRQFVDALAPSNFVMTNPEVLRATIDSRGENLLNGLKNLLDDLDRGKGRLAITMTDMAAVQDRRERRHHTRQGRLSERPDTAPAIHPDYRDREAAAAADHPALDQQVLHPRFAAAGIRSSAGRSSRATPCS